MMVILEREKTVSIPFRGVNVNVTFKVPTAEEAQTKIRGVKEITDTGIFKEFVSKVESSEIAGWECGVNADNVLHSPGTFNFVSKVAMEIVNAAFLMDSEKN